MLIATHDVTSIAMNQTHPASRGVNMGDTEGMDAFQYKFPTGGGPPEHEARDEEKR